MAGILLNRSRQVPAEETPAFGGIAERFRRAGDLDRAIALCREGLTRFPQQLSARVTLGWALLDKGQFDDARVELEQVLRKAPDNLAAIRGLAEIHERTEGALPSEDERAWKSDETSSLDDTSAPASSVAVEDEAGLADPPASASGPDLAGGEFDAPLAVTLGGDVPAEIVRTNDHAAYADQAAPVPLDIAPIDIEEPAAAALAAAVEPVPFFVDEPAGASIEDIAEQSAEPIAFEVDGTPAHDEAIDLEAGQQIHVSAAEQAIDVQEDLAAHIQADQAADEVPLSLGGVAGDAFVSFEPAAADDAGQDTDTATLDLGVDFDFGAGDELALDLEPGVPSGEPEGADQSGLELDRDALVGALDAAEFDAVEPVTHQASIEDPVAAATSLVDSEEWGEPLDGPVEAVEEASFTPEVIEDIDAEAGQDLADAIRALEEASRRVEARLALRPPNDRPAASSEEIGGVSLDGEADAGAEPRPVIDASHDGAFELTAPAVGDLSLGDVDGEVDETVAGGERSSDLPEPAFDFDALAIDSEETVPAEAGEWVSHGEPSEASHSYDAIESASLPAGPLVEPAADVDIDAGWLVGEAAGDAPWITDAIAREVVPGSDEAGVVPAGPSARQLATIAALERFLRKVQARRVALESETVA